jgi:hypothetical protein
MNSPERPNNYDEKVQGVIENFFHSHPSLAELVELWNNFLESQTDVGGIINTNPDILNSIQDDIESRAVEILNQKIFVHEDPNNKHVKDIARVVTNFALNSAIYKRIDIPEVESKEIGSE